MLAKPLRVLGWVAYVGLVAASFFLAVYFSLSLFVRSGVTPVPELAGLSEEELVPRLADQGLRLRRKAEADRYDDEIPEGQVLLQSPVAGSLVKRGSAVEITLSLGPELLEVPDVRGQALQAAQVALAAAGMTLGRTASVYSTGGLPGTVIDQEPLPGSRVGRSAPVALFLCMENRSDTYLMPDLVYRDYDSVRRFFERRGFRLGSVKFEPYEGIDPGVVLRQFPLPGHPIQRRDVISLVVTTDERIGA